MAKKHIERISTKAKRKKALNMHYEWNANVYWLKSNAISSGHKRQLLILTLFCGICCSFEFDCLLPIWRVIIMYTSQYDHNNDCNLLREYIAYNLFTTSILPPCGLWNYSRTNEINKRVNRVDKYSDAKESVSMRMIWNWKANVVRKKNNKNVTNFKQCKKERAKKKQHQNFAKSYTRLYNARAKYTFVP